MKEERLCRPDPILERGITLVVGAENRIEPADGKPMFIGELLQVYLANKSNDAGVLG
jgi:hypothetical protein